VPVPKPAEVTPARRDPARARRDVDVGRGHLRAGRFDAAEAAFHRALEADARSHEAFSGLSEVYFNRAAYQKALSYAQRAVAGAPRRADYRMQLGDAYFKVLQYDDARREYEVAARRGHPRATSALARLRERMGRG
jgi:tetratricopeptide (TPR) repeat protein